MTRVHVICEGQTEEMFVNELLQPMFSGKSVYLMPSLIGKPGHKGGNFKFERLCTDVRNYLLNDKNSYCTTFFDFYGLPNSFPGKKESNDFADLQDKANTVKNAMTNKLSEIVGQDTIQRFIPYVQMYEFEALLFSSPDSFAKSLGKESLIDKLEGIVSEFETPEHINDSPQTAPSKRIEKLIPSYEKPIMGNLAAIEVGINTMQEKCIIFNDWLKKLQGLQK